MARGPSHTARSTAGYKHVTPSPQAAGDTGGEMVITGTPAMTAISVHWGEPNSVSSDLESLLYSLIWVASDGKVPWLHALSEGQVRHGAAGLKGGGRRWLMAGVNYVSRCSKWIPHGGGTGPRDNQCLLAMHLATLQARLLAKGCVSNRTCPLACRLAQRSSMRCSHPTSSTPRCCPAASLTCSPSSSGCATSSSTAASTAAATGGVWNPRAS